MGGGLSKMLGRGLSRTVGKTFGRGLTKGIGKGISRFSGRISRLNGKTYEWVDTHLKYRGWRPHWSPEETQWHGRLTDWQWEQVWGRQKERYTTILEDWNSFIDDLFARQGVKATWTPGPACEAYGGPFMLLDSKSLMIMWIVLQVVIVPVCLFVIMLGGAPNVFPCLSGRVVPEARSGEEGIEVKDLVAVKVDGPVKLMRKKSRDRAIIATVFMVLALFMLVLQGFSIGASRYCASGVDFALGLVEKQVVGGEKSAFWALPYTLFALVSCGLCLAALLSTVKCWRGYAALKRVERDLLEIEQAGDEEERNEAFEA